MSPAMNDSDDFAALERRLVADANRLHERTVEFVDSNRLVRETRVRRTKLQAAAVAACIFVTLTTAAVMRRSTNGPRFVAVGSSHRPPAPPAVSKAAPHQVLSQTQTPIPGDPKVARSKIAASEASTSANKPSQPLEFVLTVPDGQGRRTIGRIYYLPAPNDRSSSAVLPKGAVYLVTTRRRIPFDQLSFVQQDAVRRLFGIEQPVTRTVTF
jgi:hypothetical protein